MRSSRTRAYFLFGCSIVFGLLVGGCKSAQESNSKSTAQHSNRQPANRLSADTIVQRMKQAYSNASAYQDSGILHLSYRLQGRYIEEPHLWTTRFSRPGKFNASLYNVRIKSDGQQLACFIYDFSSGNLDDQWLVQPFSDRLPLRRLFLDGIARQYVTGQTEVPVNRDISGADETFFPPTIGLLTGQTRQDWLTESETIRLEDDTTIDGRRCYQLKMSQGQIVYYVSIDADEYLIREIKYPNQLLDKRLHESSEVNNLQLIARFHGASFSNGIDDANFELEIPAEAKLVTSFVAVPEPFPSASVGKPVPGLGLVDSVAIAVKQSQWRGKVTLLAWVSDSPVDDRVEQQISKLTDELSPREYNVGQVVVLDSMDSANQSTNDRMQKMQQKVSQAVWGDYAFAGGQSIGLQSYPVFVVIDRDGRLQYVERIEDGKFNAEKAKSVLQRVRSGDDVALEMRREYESFLDDYQLRLSEANIDSESRARDNGQMVAASLPSYVRVEKIWQNDQLKQPGNVQVTESHGQQRLLVLDGWRTIVQLNLSGEIGKRKQLELDPRESVSVVRCSPVDDTGMAAVYSTMGRTVQLLDHQLDVLTESRLADDTKGRIRDVELLDIMGDRVPEMVVSFSGGPETIVRAVDGTDLGSSMEFPRELRSVAILHESEGSQQTMICDSKAVLRAIGRGQETWRRIDCDLSSATSVFSTQQTGDMRAVVCAIGTDERGQWTAVGIDARMKQLWSVPIGSQRFDSQIDSATYARLAGASSGIWAVAGNDGSIKLIGDDGKLVDQWNFGRSIHGLELIADRNRYLAVISTENHVECWSVSTSAMKSSNTSTNQR